MDKNERFYWEKEIDTDSGVEFIVLGYRGGEGDSSLEAWIIPSKGSNLCRFSVDGHHVIDFEPDRLNKNWYLGNPVLYPTPNRVLDGTFKFEGVVYEQYKEGRKILLHGFVHDEKWSCKEPVIKEDGISLETWLDIDESSSFYPSFPFRHRLSMIFDLDPSGISMTYSVMNKDEKSIPFGFALHPYFKKLSGDSGTCIKVNSDTMMACEPPYMPTGELTSVAGTVFDLSQAVPVGQRIGIDHEYYPVAAGKSAEIIYNSLNIKLDLHASGEFSHMVVFTPANDKYFCLENQTCSINAHNFHDQGFKAESGLIIVPAGEIHTGFVQYLVRKILK